MYEEIRSLLHSKRINAVHSWDFFENGTSRRIVLSVLFKVHLQFWLDWDSVLIHNYSFIIKSGSLATKFILCDIHNVLSLVSSLICFISGGIELTNSTFRLTRRSWYVSAADLC